MLLLRSADRVSGTSSDFRVRLNNHPIQGRFTLQHVTIPNSLFTLTSTTNGLAIRIGGVSSSVAITEGQYTAAGLTTAVQTALQTVDATLSCVLSALTNKVTIARGAGNCELLMAQSTIAPILGFAAADTVDATSHTAASVVDPAYRALAFHIVVDAHGATHEIRDAADRHSSFVVPITGNSIDFIQYNVGSAFTQGITFREPTQDLRVRLVDANFDPVDLSGAEWFMLLG